MRTMAYTGAALCFAVCGLLSAGCGSSSQQQGHVAEHTTDAHDHDDHGDEHGHAHGHAEGHAHGWWCDEHGVPENVCGLCNSKLAAKYQRNGDWCSQHDRPDSQCFACHPELEARFAAQYKAKYGKQPPKPEG